MYRIILIFTALVVAGCVSRPQYTSAAKPEEIVDLEPLAEAACASDLFTIGSGPKEDWWTLFDDPQLTSCIQTAFKNNPSLKSAQSKVAQAFENAKVTRSKLFPSLFFNFDDNWEHYSKDTLSVFLPGATGTNLNIIDINLDFKYEFDLWGKNRHLYAAKLGQAKAKEAEENQVKLVTAISVAKEYFSLMAYMQKQLFLKEQLEDAMRYLRVNELQYKNETIDYMTVLEQKNRVNGIKKAIYSADQDILNSKHALNTLMGLGPEDENPITYHWDYKYQVLELPHHMGSNLLKRRPDLMAQLWLIEAAAKEIGVAKALFYPDINLQAQGGFEAFQLHNLFSHDAIQGFLKPTLSLPIFTGGRLRANLKEKVAGFGVVANKFNEMMLSAAREVSDRIIDILAISDILATNVDEVKVAQRNFDLKMSRFTVGIDTLLPVLDESQVLRSKKIDRLSSEWTAYMKTLELIKSLGGGYQSEASLSYQEVVK
ncbi:MAG: efflux transporter outer membrane subunit [Simkaniaceae bacterium]|nr:efflux transporter outer membrane subunit [Simkaniaceae bacterium]